VFGSFRLIAQQALRAIHPPGSELDIPPEEKRHRQSDRGGRRLARSLTLKVQAIGPLKRSQRRVDIAQPPLGITERIEIVGSQVRLLAGGFEPVPGGGPVAPTIGAASRLQAFGWVAHARRLCLSETARAARDRDLGDAPREVRRRKSPGRMTPEAVRAPHACLYLPRIDFCRSTEGTQVFGLLIRGRE
jgi:hypothetical protein